jgi:ribosomal protein S17
MDRTVRVSFRHRAWDRHIRKHYPKETHFLVSDPNNSLREGDVIEFSSGAPKSRRVHHVVERIVAPFGTPIEKRRPVLSREERDQERERKWAAKYLRREERRLGAPVDLAGIAGLEGQGQAEGVSTAELIHRIHGANERIGRVKRLVLERTAAAEAARVEAEAKTKAESKTKAEAKAKEEPKEEQLKYE